MDQPQLHDVQPTSSEAPQDLPLDLSVRRCDADKEHAPDLNQELHGGVEDEKQCEEHLDIGTENTTRLITDVPETSFKCKDCKKGFRNEEQMKIHEKLHTKEKLYKCEVCEKIFHFRHSLTRHKDTHTEKREFKCKFCQNCYSTKQYLKVHENSHLTEKRFICDVCKETLVFKTSLERHNNFHTEKYKCDVCARLFDRNSALRNHIEKKHC